MRYGAICKSLHQLPRGGGVLDQPADEVLRLERILSAYTKYDEYQDKRNNARNKNRQRHAPRKIVVEES